MSSATEQLQIFEATASTPIRLSCVVTKDGLLVKRLINQWHSSLSAPTGWRIAFLLLDNFTIVGVSTWGRPVARMEDRHYTLEHTRMALHDAPRNSASWFIAQNRRWIRENMPEIRRLITYVDRDIYTGVTYRSDNWRLVYEKRTHHTWTNRPGRKGVEAKFRAKFEREP